ncbi:MAG: hypothetical protein ACOC7K_00215 [bacterium]
MSQDRKPKKDNEFVEELERLRTKIDMLPQSHRPHLHELADAIGEQYDKQRQLGTHKPVGVPAVQVFRRQ